MDGEDNEVGVDNDDSDNSDAHGGVVDDSDDGLPTHHIFRVRSLPA